MDSKEAIAQFKEWYFEFYGVKPTEKLIETFCKMKGIEIKREEVVKVEEIKVCSILADVPTVASAGTEPLPYTEENFRALETNYNNLLSDYEEICNIAQEQAKIIERYQKAEIEAIGGTDG